MSESGRLPTIGRIAGDGEPCFTLEIHGPGGWRLGHQSVMPLVMVATHRMNSSKVGSAPA